MKPELQVLQDYIRRRGLRRTPERERVLQEIFETHGHFDVDELYLKLRHKGVKVSKASIYRALPLFIDCGLIREVDFTEGHWHYEHIYGHNDHCHLRCLGCGEMLEFEEPTLKPLEEFLENKYHYRIKGHQLQVHGLCPTCQLMDSLGPG
jgi:Fur family ferric uptake transcriptional regulator